MNPTTVSTEAMEVLLLLLSGSREANRRLANTLRVEAHGVSTFGRTDGLDHFARHPLVLSPSPHVLAGPEALAILDTDADGATIGVFADLADGVLARVWVAGPVSADARPEAAVPVASDDFMHQDRVVVAGDPQDHPRLAAVAWPQVQAASLDALAAAADGPAASSSQAWVVRAFSSRDGFAALLALRLQASTAPGAQRSAHHRWAVALGRVGVDGGSLHRRIAVSAAWPVPMQALF